MNIKAPQVYKKNPPVMSQHRPINLDSSFEVCDVRYMYVTLLNKASLFLPNVQELLGNANMGRMEKLNT